MIGVVVFPGTNCERDTARGLEAVGAEAELVWHGDDDLTGVEAVVLPGGFAHGDYLRTGAIAARSPVMTEVVRLATEGRPVLGICNGFQVLCESGLLMGALIANRDLRFISRLIDVEVTDTDTVLTRGLESGTRLRIALNSYQGNHRDPTGEARVVVRYVDDPNGSQNGAAAVANASGNVVGIMPHPERATELILGSADGRAMLESFARSVETTNV